ncbi:hypothetical protein ACE6H2_006516 [Prunus campanulata]
MVCFLVLSGVFCNYLKQRVPRFKFEKIRRVFDDLKGERGEAERVHRLICQQDEELETFRFDLGWLEPRVQYALGVKRLVQRAARRKRLREDVDDLENEIKRQKHNVVVLELKFRGRGLHLLLQR